VGSGVYGVDLVVVAGHRVSTPAADAEPARLELIGRGEVDPVDQRRDGVDLGPWIHGHADVGAGREGGEGEGEGGGESKDGPSHDIPSRLEQSGRKPGARKIIGGSRGSTNICDSAPSNCKNKCGRLYYQSACSLQPI